MYLLTALVYFSVALTTVNCDSVKLYKYFDVTQTSTNGNSFRENGQNSLRCARACKKEGACLGLIYNKTEKLCEVVTEFGQPGYLPSVAGTSYVVASRTYKKCGEWKRAFAVNSSGVIIFGDISNLKSSLLSGYPMRIGLRRPDNDGQIDFQMLSVNSVFVADSVICCQSEEYPGNQDNFPDLVSYLICTDGLVQSKRGNVATNNITINTLGKNAYIESTWFIQETDCLQDIYNDDSMYLGNIYDQLYSMEAFTATVAQTFDEGTKVHYKTQTKLLPSDKHVTVTSYGEFSKTIINSSMTYTENTSLVTTLYNFTENIEETLCKVNRDRTCEVQIKTVNQRSYINGNWKKVLQHTSSGEVVSGNFLQLRVELMNGNRVLVHFNGEVKEPDVVVLNDDNATAFFTLFPQRQEGNADNTSNALIEWEMLSTTGRYESAVFNFSTGYLISSMNGSVECSWFVENTRWTQVHDSTNSDTSKIVASIKSGLRLRMRTHCLEYYNSPASVYTCLHDLVHTRIIRQTVKARTGMHPSILSDRDGLHLAVHDRPIWMAFAFNITSSEFGKLRRKIWTQGNSYFDEMSYHGNDEINEALLAN